MLRSAARLALDSVSAVDGRYATLCAELSGLLSESAIIRYRVRVEVEWLCALVAKLPELSGVGPAGVAALRSIADSFGPAEASRVKAIEERTKHDVKAVEYFIKDAVRD